MFGTVDASASWQAQCAKIVKYYEFVQGLGYPSVFVHVKRDIRLLVHCDFKRARASGASQHGLKERTTKRSRPEMRDSSSTSEELCANE